MSLFEQSPCFTVDEHVSMMNSQWHHILRRPTLQDLRRLKFTRQLVQTKHYNLTNLHIYIDRHEGQMFRQYSAGDINLRGILLIFGGFFSVVAATTVVARTFPVRVCGSFIFIIFERRLWRCSAFSSLLLFNQLKEAKKEI
jgi:hypothetical protein